MTNGERLSEVRRLNQEGAEDLRLLAEQAREKAIDKAYDAVRVHLDADKALVESLEEVPEGTNTRFYILESYTDAPFKKYYHEHTGAFPNEGEDQATQDTISLVFFPGNLDKDRPLLRVHIPVSEGFNIRDYTMPPRDEVEEIYLEYISPTSTQRFVLNKKYMYEYVSAEDTATNTEDVLGSDEEMMQVFTRKPSRFEDANAITAAVKVYADILDGQAIPQRHSRVGDGEVTDIIP